MTAHDLAIENTAKFFEFCDKLISNITGDGIHGP
jgi:hypothetical protein